MAARVWLPFRGEFGSKLMWHVPVFNGRDRIEGIIDVACHEQYQECLYPSADEHFIVKSPEDHNATGALGAPGDDAVYDEVRAHFGPDAEYVVPVSACWWKKAHFLGTPLKTYDLAPDVILCKRMKTANGGKIWPHWEYVKEKLEATGLTVYTADNFNTDEILWAMMHTKFVLSVYTGSLFLSLMGGMHTHIICAEGFLECAGGVEIISDYLLGFHDVAKAGWAKLPLWEKPDEVVQYILDYLRNKDLSDRMMAAVKNPEEMAKLGDALRSNLEHEMVKSLLENPFKER